MMSMLCNCCVRELLILARTWFAFGLPSKTGCDTFAAPAYARTVRLVRQGTRALRQVADCSAHGRGPFGPWRGLSTPVQRAPMPVPVIVISTRKGVNNDIKKYNCVVLRE
jgi:hypothetical protein